MEGGWNTVWASKLLAGGSFWGVLGATEGWAGFSEAGGTGSADSVGAAGGACDGCGESSFSGRAGAAGLAMSWTFSAEAEVGSEPVGAAAGADNAGAVVCGATVAAAGAADVGAFAGVTLGKKAGTSILIGLKLVWVEVTARWMEAEIQKI